MPLTRSPRLATSPPSHPSFPLLFCAAALAAAPGGVRAQEPPPADSARPPAPAPADTGRARTRPPAPPDSVPAPVQDVGRGLPPAATDTLLRPVDTGAARAADTACVRVGFPGDVVCSARAILTDSARFRALAALAAEKILKHAAREDRLRRAPVTWAEYKRSAFGSEALLRVAAVAAWDQLLGRGGWGRDGLGYALRFTTRLGSEAAAGYVRFEVASHVRVREAPYVPCACQGAGPRLLHALTAPFRTGTLDGGERFSPLTPVTELGGGMLLATVGTGGVRPRQGMVAGLNGLLSLSLVATLREFRPWELWKTPR